MERMNTIMTEEQRIKRNEKARKYRSENKDKLRELHRQWRLNNPHKVKEAYHKRHRREFAKYYGITWEEYKRMWIEQEGCCAICRKYQTEFKDRLCVDHNHSTGTIRGLLCHKCNRGIGHFDDDYHSLLNALEYIKKAVNNEQKRNEML